MRLRWAGLPAWAIQRASAVYMLAFLIAALLSLATRPRTNYQDWSAWVRGPLVSALTGLFFLALFSHLWVGLRDVILDYAKPDWFRRGLLGSVVMALLGLTAWTAVILFAY